MGLGIQPVPPDPYAVVGRVALRLARDGAAGLPGVLALVVERAALRSAVLTSGAQLLAAAGEQLRSVPDGPQRPVAGAVQVAVPGPRGEQLAVLSVTGARPSALPLLRDVAVVLGLALDADAPAPPTGAALLRDGDSDRAAVADALHDGPVQDLLAARYAADAALRSPAPDLTAVRSAVQAALVALRRTMSELRPRGAEGLEGALQGLSSRLAAAGAAGLRLRVDPQADALGAAAVAVAYRLVQQVAPGPAADGDVRVSLQPGRAPGTALLTVVGGRTLPDAPRWRRAAAALGGDLLTTAGRLHLTLPLAGSGEQAPATPTRTENDTSTAKAVL